MGGSAGSGKGPCAWGTPAGTLVGQGPPSGSGHRLPCIRGHSLTLWILLEALGLALASEKPYVYFLS